MSYGLDSALERLLPDTIFEEVMQTMGDSAWLRERAETIAASGRPGANEKAAALIEAADELDGVNADATSEETTPASAEGAP